jgi:hypothetical protein
VTAGADGDAVAAGTGRDGADAARPDGGASGCGTTSARGEDTLPAARGSAAFFRSPAGVASGVREAGSLPSPFFGSSTKRRSQPRPGVLLREWRSLLIIASSENTVPSGGIVYLRYPDLDHREPPSGTVLVGNAE